MSMIENMLHRVTVKEGGEYVDGKYSNRVPVFGMYLEPIKGSLLDKTELTAKRKFRLENDPENYASDGRMETWLAIERFIDKHGDDCTESHMNAWVHRVVKNKLQDKSRDCKSNISVYDSTNKEYFLVNLYNIDMVNGLTEYLNEISDEICDNEVNVDFLTWIKNDSYRVLTDKQVRYLNNEFIPPSDYAGRKMISNICNRLNRYYGDYERDLFRKVVKESKIEEAGKWYVLLLEDECFEEYLYENKDNFYTERLIHIVYNHLEFNQYKEFTNILNKGEVCSNKLKNNILDVVISEIGEKIEKFDEKVQKNDKKAKKSAKKR